MAIRKKETKELKEEIKTPSKRKYTRKKKSEQQIIEDSSKNVKIPSSSGVILPKIDIEGIKVENNEKQESNNVQSATLSVSLNNVSNNEIKNDPADVALFADIYHDIRRARPSGNMAQHHTRRRNNGLCTA